MRVRKAMAVRRSASMAVLFRARDAGLREGRLPFQTGDRRARERDRQRGAGTFAGPHIEIQQRTHTERGEKAPVAGLRRNMTGATMGKRVWRKKKQRRDR